MHEHNNISFLHDISFSLLLILSVILHLGHTRSSTMQRLKIIKIGHFGLDETSLKISVDDAGSLGCQCSDLDCPGSYLLRSSCVEGLEAKGGAAGSDYARNDGFSGKCRTLEAHVCCHLCTFVQIGFLGVGIILHIKIFLLKFATHGNNLSATMSLHPFLNLWKPLRTLTNEILLGHVDHIDLWLGRDHVPILNTFHLARGKLSRLNRRIIIQECLDFIIRILERFGQRRFSTPCQTLLLPNAILLGLQYAPEGGQILQTQLALNRLQISDGIDAIIHMNDLVRIKGSHQMEDSIHGCDMGQKCITQSRTLRRTLDQSGNIRYLQNSRDD
mmetsp:Transcript_20538/g.30089  ORF Transcript_20538/g.30089 Transcript_20538/m.30089 type:complete len:330 (+) Transcript_20538:418-1407(+)